MPSRPDDVRQSLGLPDFVDPVDVGEASLAASQTWGDERPATARGLSTGDPAAGVARPFGSAGHESRFAGDDSGDGDNASARPGRAGRQRQGRGGSASGYGQSSFGTSSFGASSWGVGARSGAKRKAKKQLTWAEKAGRREKRAAARREAEAAEREKDPIGYAREIVLTQLTAMPRSRSQLADKLREKEVSEDVIDVVLDRMEDIGLVDDEAYAAMLVRSKLASRGLARRALRQELKRKGINDDVATVALEQVDDDVEREQALVLARKKMVTMSRLDEPTQTRRLAGLLARKGYSGELVWSVIRQVQEEAS